jgi:hypothetical protein
MGHGAGAGFFPARQDRHRARPVGGGAALARTRAPAGAGLVHRDVSPGGGAAELRRFDLREGWILLGAARLSANAPDEAAAAIAEALRRHAPDRSVAGLLTEIARSAGWPGWCGLSGDGTLQLDRPAGLMRAETALHVSLDGVAVRPKGRGERVSLPPGWERAASIAVSRGGRALLGSPIDVAAILRTEGFVEAVEGELTGWIWHPGEPERSPVVTLTDCAGRSVALAMERLAELPTAESPLARPRLLSLDPARLGRLRLADGPVAGRPARASTTFLLATA